MKSILIASESSTIPIENIRISTHSAIVQITEPILKLESKIVFLGWFFGILLVIIAFFLARYFYKEYEKVAKKRK